MSQSASGQAQSSGGSQYFQSSYESSGAAGGYDASSGGAVESYALGSSAGNGRSSALGSSGGVIAGGERSFISASTRSGGDATSRIASDLLAQYGNASGSTSGANGYSGSVSGQQGGAALYGGSSSYEASGASANYGTSGGAVGYQTSGSTSFQTSGSTGFQTSGGSAGFQTSGGSTSYQKSGSYISGRNNSSAGVISNTTNGGSAGALSVIEQQILRSTVPIDINESEKISVQFKGQTEHGVWANRSEVINWRGVIPIEQYIINEDLNPEVITKRTERALVYIQELAIRYLRPPTPPPPGEIIIKQDGSSNIPPAPPLVLRQIPARADTPEPLVIREAPPQAPAAVGRKVITIGGKRIPPPPRKVIIERLAPLPSKPQSVLVERWLPYSQVKRRVIFQRQQEADAVVVKPRNVIIQWQAPSVEIKKEFKYLGVIRANPVEYVQRYGSVLKQASQLPQFVLDIKTPDGLVLAADYKFNGVHELTGDVKALQLINLQEEGLSEYQTMISRWGFNYVGESRVQAKLAELNQGGSLSFHESGAAGGSSSFGTTSNATGFIASGNTSSGSSAFGTSSGAAGFGTSSGAAGFGTSSGAAGFGTSSGAAGFGSASGLDSFNGAAGINGLTSGGANEATIQAIFRQIDRDNSGQISVDEAGAILLKINSQLGRGYGENDIKSFFAGLDTNRNGELSFEEFKAAFKALLG